MKKYAPRKVFILGNNEYIEISYEELCYREEIDPSYKDKLFIPLHGMIMEVDETAYRDFYKAKDRDEYLTWRTKYKDISYSQFDDDECCGEDMLADNSEDIAEVLAWQQILDKLRLIVSMLPEDEKELITAHFYKGKSQTALAKEYGVNQSNISRKISKILAKIKNLIEI